MITIAIMVVIRVRTITMVSLILNVCHFFFFIKNVKLGI